jgi:hypothetical protein
MPIQTEIEAKCAAIQARSAAIIDKSAVVRAKSDELIEQGRIRYQIVHDQLKSRATQIYRLLNNT